MDLKVVKVPDFLILFLGIIINFLMIYIYVHIVETITIRKYLLVSDAGKYLTSDLMSWLILGRDFGRKITDASTLFEAGKRRRTNKRIPYLPC